VGLGIGIAAKRPPSSSWCFARGRHLRISFPTAREIHIFHFSRARTSDLMIQSKIRQNWKKKEKNDSKFPSFDEWIGVVILKRTPRTNEHRDLKIPSPVSSVGHRSSSAEARHATSAHRYRYRTVVAEYNNYTNILQHTRDTITSPLFEDGTLWVAKTLFISH
jgi:hypothetical protein